MPMTICATRSRKESDLRMDWAALRSAAVLGSALGGLGAGSAAGRPTSIAIVAVAMATRLIGLRIAIKQNGMKMFWRAGPKGKRRTLMCFAVRDDTRRGVLQNDISASGGRRRVAKKCTIAPRAR